MSEPKFERCKECEEVYNCPLYRECYLAPVLNEQGENTHLLTHKKDFQDEDGKREQ